MQRRDLLAGLAGLGLASKGLTQSTDLAKSAKRVALMIGMSEYIYGPKLPSAAPDAYLLAQTFAKLGFETAIARNVTRDDFLIALARFRVMAADAELAVIYVAGHGLMHNGQSHILTSETAFDGRESVSQSIPESVLLRAISDQPRQKVLFLDTCRGLPTPLDIKPNNPETTVLQFAGSHISYATQPGAPAYDGGTEHSPFAIALEAALSMPGLEMSELSRQVRLKVLQSTSGLQIPWEKSSLLLPVIFNQIV